MTYLSTGIYVVYLYISIKLIHAQLIKSFEITNTLADVILCTTSTYNHALPDTRNPRRESFLVMPRESWKCGPADFLHALYQIISPFLTYDKRLYDMIRLKAADALLQSPSRIIPKSVDEVSKETEVGVDQEESGDTILEQLLEYAAEANTRNVELGNLGLGLDGLNDSCIEELLGSDTLQGGL